MICLHCSKEHDKQGSALCDLCLKLPRCQGCQVIFGHGLAKPSDEDVNRCDSCLHFEERIMFSCKCCDKKLPMFYSPNSDTFHFVVRGNFCAGCNNQCAIASRERRPEVEGQEYKGYLAILHKQMQMGNVSAFSFNEAAEMNQHDISTYFTKLNTNN